MFPGEERVMKWYQWRFFRLAYAPRKTDCREITDRRGRWRRLVGGWFYLVKRT